MATNRSRSIPARGREFGRLVAGYSLAAGGALALAPDAAAAPIPAKVAPVTLSQGGERVVMDLDGDRLGDFVVRAHNYLDGILFDIISHVYESTEVVRNVVAHNYEAASGDLGITLLRRGQQVGPDTTDWQGRFADLNDPSLGVLLETDTPSGPFLNSRGFIGLFFEFLDGSHHFGYLELEGTGAALTILGGAFESQPDAPIQIPTSVPEPGSLALLACGAAGLAAWRRARKQPHG